MIYDRTGKVTPHAFRSYPDSRRGSCAACGRHKSSAMHRGNMVDPVISRANADATAGISDAHIERGCE